MFGFFHRQGKATISVVLPHVHFQPWTGSAYLHGINGRKVLVLGESHYCAKPEDDVPAVTVNVIRDLLDPDSEFEAYKNTYTKFERALAGKELDWSGKAELWNSVVFYNYVQVPMSGPRRAPAAAEFRASEAAFFEILEHFRPDCVIVWGSRLYNNLPQAGRQGPDLRLPDGTHRETWTYTLSGGHTVRLLPITHPSAGFTPAYWHEAIMSFINR